MSSTEVQGRQFRFRDFLRSVEAYVWRVEQAITPLLVSLSPSASNAFTADTAARRATGVVQPRDLQILARLNANPSKPL